MATLAIPSTNLKLVQEPTAPVVPAPVVEKPRISRAKILLPILVAIAAIGSGTTYALSLGTETTDDAQVEGHVANVSPRIGGQVKRVLIQDNQEVKAGDVLVEL